MDNIDITRKPNETDFEYHKRIIYGKRVDKTLSDMDYSELSKFAYGRTLSFDVARRMFQGSEETLLMLDREREENIESKKLLSELDEKMIELRKERQKFFDQRREYSKIVSSEARYEHILSELCRSAQQLSNTVGCMYNHIDRSDYLTTCDTCDSEAVLVLSDWHYGLKTDNVFNKYDTDICKSRVKNVSNKTVNKLLLHQCHKLHIVVLGDLIHGAIHTSARVASEELVCDQLMQASEILAQTIEMLSAYVDETVVYVTYGNHARTVQAKNDSVHRDNMERLIPWWLSQRLSSYGNIYIQDDTGTEFLFVTACGHQLCASHGDNDAVKSSPRILSTLFKKKYKKDIEYILLGDKHHRESFEELGVTSMICGSLCGADDYANSKRLYSTPSQLLLIVTPADGVDAEYQIKCE